ncbi:receptor-type tyrosine-protein phosphatase alpha-like [Ostrea edulis]|uniref:receptor-type tyrosine-protein phosphatase alpha-like n=1 Tax=Ostrea edulis TaxID=37623 RepID=UPI0024AE8CB5|nr:receptor-type tyrosine-protein phosphatase alpha-like [Ostrea edulis]XP_056002217.1 receptor-type tyrosine-protein phosphatase alpha-like [Ostrea edulis]XP_056002218.1 receptor-type tyrosine-protein phosphatase alpha-like [Ostrea edulis]
MILFVSQFMLLVTCIRAYENLALRRPAWQQSEYPDRDWGAEKAVDGKYTDRSSGGNQCTISNNGQTTAMWRVNLESVVSISHIDIYYRTDKLPSPSEYTTRFAGFYLYVSNTTSKDDGHLCFHEIQNVNGTPVENQTISCSVHGQYVIYYNERKQGVNYPSFYSPNAFNELCELEVYGCPDPKYFGVNCDQPCPDGCQEKRCDVITGHCLGCIPGYQDPRCTKVCDAQTYGLECSSSCGNCSDGETCHHVNGKCPQGCDAGVHGEKCKNPCQTGSYGKNCGQNCSENCNVTNHCNRFTGECDGGCKPGWKMPTCQQECGGGMYGTACRQRCGQCLDNEQCHHINGMCLNGCSSGYQGGNCEETCDEKFWGVGCRKNCSSNCVNETCQHDTGVCHQNKFTALPPDKGSSAVPVVAGIIAAVFVIIIILVMFFFRRARSQGKDKAESPQSEDRRVLQTNVKSQSRASSSEFNNLYANTSDNKTDNNDSQRVNNASLDKSEANTREDDVDIDEKVHEENPYGDLDIKEEIIPDILLSKLEAAIEEKRRDEDDGFKREYANLPYGERFPCNNGKLPENITKNRFKTTFPYDHSRIQLKTTPSDYINANFIHGVERMNEYIASQGPKQNTLSDFWTMIWQENVRQIIMLTNLREGNKAKCVQYWADIDVPATFGVFSLRTVEEKHYAFYIIRTFRVTNNELKKTHMVTQYHYTAWPDHGTPEPLCLVNFHDHVTRTKDKADVGPTLVHCSAGIGRTGTYIAIDALHWAGKKDKKINIAEYVKKMRENRMNMVQTYEQYRSIFLALNDMVKAPTAVQKKTQFVQKAEEIQNDKPVNQSDLGKEFQTLMKVRPSYTDADYKFALQSGSDRTRILPLDKYSLYLSFSGGKRGNYINAISVPSYDNQDAFVVTQYPQIGDAVDFLRLLTDHELDTVICLDAMREVESTTKWLPSKNSSKSVTPFTVHCHQEESTDVQSTTLHVVKEGTNVEARSITIVEPQLQLQAGRGTTQMLSLLRFALSSRAEGPITVVSRDGATLCGVFCAAHNVLQQLSMDGEVDIFSAVRQLHVRRPELCSSLAKYRMIHDVVLHYIRSREGHLEENIYSNQ